MKTNTCLKRIFVCAVLLSVVGCDTLNDVMTLYDTLFDNYNSNVRGVMDQTKAVKVKANFSLISLGKVNERDEAFEVMGLLYLSWTDERLVWNSSQYNGTKEIIVYQDAVWKPEVMLSNPKFEVNRLGHDRTQIRIYNTGELGWMTPDNFKATCSIDVVSFPWDRQSCRLEFIVSTYRNSEVIIEADSDSIDTNGFDEHESWDLVGTHIDRILAKNSRVQFWLCLERRSAFHVFVIFIPVVTLSILNAFVFFVKIDSGERISLAVTLLLSITLYLSLIAENLPTHSKGLASIIYCLNFVLLESTGICIISILSLHIYHKHGIPPYVCQLIVKKCLGSSQEEYTSRTGEIKTGEETLENNSDQAKDDVLETDQNLGITWRDVSLYIDRSFFCLSSAAIILSFIIFTVFVVHSRVECP